MIVYGTRIRLGRAYPWVIDIVTLEVSAVTPCTARPLFITLGKPSKKSFSFRCFKSPTLTLALLQVVHPDLTFLCGRLIRKVDISTSAITASFLVAFRVSCPEAVDPGNRLVNDPKVSSLPHISICSDAQDLLFDLSMRLHCKPHFRWLNHLIPEAVQLGVLKVKLPSVLAFVESG